MIDKTPEEELAVVLSLCKGVGLLEEEAYALYLVLGRDIFFLFDMMAGRTVSFPKTISVRTSFRKGYTLIELSEPFYVVNDEKQSAVDILKGDLVEVQDTLYLAMGSPVRLGGHLFLLTKENRDE